MESKFRIALISITGIILIIGVSSSNMHFISSSLLTFVTIGVMEILFKKSKVKIPPIMKVLSYVFIFLSMNLGKSLSFYGVPYWDKFLHLSSGVILGFIGLLVLWSLNAKSSSPPPHSLTIAFVIIFSIACAGLWEVWEFTTDSLLNLNAQNGSLVDTMWDIICGTVGGSFVSLLLYIYYKGKGCSFFKDMFNYMEENPK